MSRIVIRQQVPVPLATGLHITIELLHNQDLQLQNSQSSRERCQMSSRKGQTNNRRILISMTRTTFLRQEKSMNTTLR